MHGTIPHTPAAGPGSGQALVEAQVDHRVPGRTAYRITSMYSPGAVQSAVSALMSADGVRMSEFTHVRRERASIGKPPVWFALGFTITASSFLQAAE